MRWFQLASLVLVLAAAVSDAALPNLNGEVVILTDQTWSLTQQGPWFIMYSAPWCHFCHFMWNDWVQMAKDMRGIINVAKIDCADSQATCVAQMVHTYPQMHYLVNGVKKRHYHHDRTAVMMGGFARLQVSTDFPEIIEEYERTVSNQDKQDQPEHHGGHVADISADPIDHEPVTDWALNHNPMALPPSVPAEVTPKFLNISHENDRQIDELLESRVGLLVLKYHARCSECDAGLQIVADVADLVASQVGIVALQVGESYSHATNANDALFHGAARVFPSLEFWFWDESYPYLDELSVPKIVSFVEQMVNPFSTITELRTLRRDVEVSHFILLLPVGLESKHKFSDLVDVFGKLAREYRNVARFYLSHDPGVFLPISELTITKPSLSTTELPIFESILAVIRGGTVSHHLLTTEKNSFDMEATIRSNLLALCPQLNPWTWSYVIEDFLAQTVLVGLYSHADNNSLVESMHDVAHREVHAFTPPRFKFLLLNITEWPHVRASLWSETRDETSLLIWKPKLNQYLTYDQVAPRLGEERSISDRRTVQLVLDVVVDWQGEWHTGLFHVRGQSWSWFMILALSGLVIGLIAILRAACHSQRISNRWDDASDKWA